MKKKVYDEKSFTVSAWTGGSSVQMLILPEDGNYASRNFSARISSAFVDAERSDFTVLPEVRRFIAPLDNKLILTHNGKDFIELEPFDVYEFDGGSNTVSFGKARDVNLMLKNGASGFMKAWNLCGELSVETGRNGLVWIFSCMRKIKIFMEGEELTLEPFSLLTFSGFDKDVNLKLKAAAVKPSVLGGAQTGVCAACESSSSSAKLLYGNIRLPDKDSCR